MQRTHRLLHYVSLVKERVVIFFSDQSDPDLMKSLALDVVYENESLLNNFKKEYKPLR